MEDNDGDRPGVKKRGRNERSRASQETERDVKYGSRQCPKCRTMVARNAEGCPECARLKALFSFPEKKRYAR